MGYLFIFPLFVSLCNEVFEVEKYCSYNSIAARLNAGEFEV